MLFLFKVHIFASLDRNLRRFLFARHFKKWSHTDPEAGPPCVAAIMYCFSKIYNLKMHIFVIASLLILRLRPAKPVLATFYT